VVAVWPAWLGVSEVSIVCLVYLVSRRAPDGSARRRVNVDWSLPRIVVDLVAMFLLASGLRTLWSGGLTLPGASLPRPRAAPSWLRLPTTSPSPRWCARVPASPWTAILAMSMGANLFLTGSVATVLCRRLVREGGATFSLRRFFVAGAALMPVQLTVAYAGLRVTGVLR
jgi:hypothetical protein